MPILHIDGADVEYTDVGTGPVIVFVHGVYVTGALWNDVVSALGPRFRCLVPTWPLGAHRAVKSDADLNVAVTAQRIVHLLEKLDLSDVTVVANDTGGGLVLTALGDPSLDLTRIGRLVLTNSDSYEHFPPGAFRHIVSICRRSTRLGGGILRLLATRRGQAFFLSAVCRTAVRDERRAEIFGAFATSVATRRQAVAVTASLDPALTTKAAASIERFDKPVRLVWGTEDDLFPLAHARRLANAFPLATLTEVPNSSTYVMLDAPTALADAIAEVSTAR
jgi:pimeloyl-ACP methyl ester carboxylesterase